MSEVWYDTRLGEALIGDDAIIPRLQESTPGDVVPLQDLILHEDFPFNRHDFSKVPSAEWSRGDIMAVGHTTLKLLEHTEHAGMITRRTLLRLYFLGLGPQPEAFFGTGKEFSTMQEYRKEIGAESGYSPRGKFDDWTTQDFVNYAQTVEQIVGRKPTMTDYRQLGEEDPDVPTLYIITQRFKKGVSELNEHLGYPNTKNWGEDDYIDFGAKFVEVNGAALLKLPCITALSAKKRGPGYATIVRKFDSWDNFRAQAVAEYHDRAQMHKEERERKLTMYQTMIGQKILPASWAALPENDLLLYGARYMLSVKVRPEMTPNQRFRSIQSPEPHHFVRGLLRDNDRHTTPASIELEASIMGVYDDLWPMDQYKEYLKVTEAEVAAQITRRNQTKKRWYHTAQASASQA